MNMRKFTLFFAALLVALGVSAQTASDYYTFEAEVLLDASKRLTSQESLTAGKHIVIQHCHEGTKHEGHEGSYLTIYSLPENYKHRVYMQENAVGVSIFTAEEGSATDRFKLQTSHKRCKQDAHNCYVQEPDQYGEMTAGSTAFEYVFKYVSDGKWQIVAPAKNYYSEDRYLWVNTETDKSPTIGIVEGINNASNADKKAQSYFYVYEVNPKTDTRGTIQYVKNATVRLTGPAGNQITTTHSGWSDYYEFVMYSGDRFNGRNYGVSISNVLYHSNANLITGDISYPFAISGDVAKIPVHLCPAGGSNRLAIVDGVLKTLNENTASAEVWKKNNGNQWYIYPKFVESATVGKSDFVYAIQNVATKQYLKYSTETGAIELSEAFDNATVAALPNECFFNLNGTGDLFYFLLKKGSTDYYLYGNNGTVGSTYNYTTTGTKFKVLNVESTELDGVPSVGFTRYFHEDTYFWDGGIVATANVTDGVKAALNNIDHEDRDSGTHNVYTAKTGITVTQAGQVNVIFNFTQGNNALQVLGVDIVTADGSIVSYDYHAGKAGNPSNNNQYILKNVGEGKYYLRYWVCNYVKSDYEGHDLAKVRGSIVVHGANYRWEPATTLDVNNATWYRMRLSDGLERYISAQADYVDGKKNLLLSNHTPPTDYAGLWTMVGDAENGYKFYNRAKGADYALKTDGEGANARTYLAPVDYASTYDVVQQDGNYQFFVKLHGTDNYLYKQGDYLATAANALGDANAVMTFETVNSTGWGLGLGILDLTTDPNAPVYYMIKNVRSGAYATYSDYSGLSYNDYTGPRNMHLTPVAQPIAAHLFYFIGELSEDGQSAKVKIHNYATGNKCAGVDSWNADGIEWGISVSANTDNGGGLAIYKYSNSGDHGSNTASSWNNAGGDGQKIGWWKSNDIGSTWVLEKVDVNSCLSGTATLASNVPANDNWADGTKWFLLRGEKTQTYISTKDDYIKDGKYLAYKSDFRPKDLNGYWAFVGNETDGYQIFNAAEGPGKVLNMKNEEENARAELVPIAQATDNSRFDIRYHEENKAWYLKVHGNDRYMNDRDGYLAFWKSTAAFGNNGSQFDFMPVPVDATDLQNAVNAAKDKAQQELNATVSRCENKVSEFIDNGVPADNAYLTALATAIENAKNASTFEELYAGEFSMQEALKAVETYGLFYVDTYYRLKLKAADRYMTEVTANKDGGLQIKDKDDANPTKQWFQFVADAANQGKFFIQAYAGGQIYTEGTVNSWHMKTTDAGVPFMVEYVGENEYKILKEAGLYTAPNEGNHGDGEIIYSNHNKTSRTDLVWVLERVSNAEVASVIAEPVLNETPATVGYPNNAERETLQNAINAVKDGTASPTKLKDKVLAFKGTANVNMPESGKAYVIRNVQKNGTKYMLSSAYNNAYLPVATDDAKNDAANVFVCRVTDNGYVFVNAKHGQYMLYYGVSNTDPYDSDGFSENFSDNNVLKLNPHGATLLGSLSITGKRNRTENDGYATMTIASNGNMNANSGENSVTYNDSYSSLFIFEEVTSYNKVGLTTISKSDKLLSGADLVGKTISTFSAPYATVIPKDVTAYYAAEAEEAGQLILKPVDGKALPAKQGVVLVGEEGVTSAMMLPVAGEATADLTDNMFKHSATGPVTMGANDYILSKTANYGIGLYKASQNSTLKQGKAYLTFTGSGANSFVLNFSGVTTDIEGAPTVAPSQQVIYDLSGRRVSAVTKGGIYIVNGKKMIIK